MSTEIQNKTNLLMRRVERHFNSFGNLIPDLQSDLQDLISEIQIKDKKILELLEEIEQFKKQQGGKDKDARCTTN